MSQAASSATSIANGGNISDVGGGGSNGGGVSLWVIVGIAGGAVVLGLVVWFAVKKGK